MNKTVIMSIPILFCVHWISIQLYVTLCAPPGWSGFYHSVITSPSPICIALNHIQYYAIHYYYNIWLAVGLFALTTFQYRAGQLVNSSLCQTQDPESSNSKPVTRSEAIVQEGEPRSGKPRTHRASIDQEDEPRSGKPRTHRCVKNNLF